MTHDDDDIWSSDDADPIVEPRSAPAPAPRRGPSRPPRRGGPRRPAGGPARTRRPGRPGAAPAEPVSGQVAAVGVGHGAGERGYDDDHGYDDGHHDDGHHDDGHDYVELPPERSLPRWLRLTIVLLLLPALVIGAAVGGAWWWYGKQVDPSGSPGQAVTVEIPTGSSTSGIGSILEKEGVITNGMLFNFYAGRHDAGPFQAGVYELQVNSSFDQAIAKLEAGPDSTPTPTVVKVTIPEGYTVARIVERIHEKVPRLAVDDLRAALDGDAVPSGLRPDGESFEGLLFPATYEVGGKATAAEVLTLLSEEMESRVAGLDPEAAKARIKDTYGLDLSTYELITVASMIQAEAGNPGEASKIATVIYNRLEQGMALGIDAADKYGAVLAGTEVDYEDTSAPYNTRRNQGLPPTPIAAPGDAALSAAMNPAEGAWRYYVLTEPNVHTFVVTDAEFQQAKSICVQKGLGCGPG